MQHSHDGDGDGHGDGAHVDAMLRDTLRAVENLRSRERLAQLHRIAADVLTNSELETRELEERRTLLLVGIAVHNAEAIAALELKSDAVVDQLHDAVARLGELADQFTRQLERGAELAQRIDRAQGST